MTRDELIDLARALGDPRRDFVVLAEGNVSARTAPTSFTITTSGSVLASLSDRDLVEVDLGAALEPLHADPSSAAEPLDVRSQLGAAVIPELVGERRRPSIETILHAVLLERTGATVVGHTHPTAIVGLSASASASEVFGGALFPDEVVVCGPRYLVVPYVAPGAELARALSGSLDGHRELTGEWPRAIILANHGLIALGATAAEVIAITTMAEKAARARVVALAAGGLNLLPDPQVDALVGRHDEHLRRQRLVEGPA